MSVSKLINTVEVRAAWHYIVWLQFVARFQHELHLSLCPSARSLCHFLAQLFAVCGNVAVINNPHHYYRIIWTEPEPEPVDETV